MALATSLNHVEFIATQFIICIQLILIITSIIQFKRRNAESDDSIMHHAITKWYFILLCLGILVLIIADFLSISGKLDFNLINDIYCTIAAIILNSVLIIYLASVYMFYLYRIYQTFHGSSFAVTDNTFNIIASITWIVCILSIGTMSYFFIMFYQKNEENMAKINYFCYEGSLSVPISPNIRIALQVMIVISNIFYGYWFYESMRRFLFFTKNCVGIARAKKFQLKSLLKIIQKQSTLIFVSTFSTIILWSLSSILYFESIPLVQIWIYLDILINCICIWLMFSFNNGYFRKYCKICFRFSDKPMMQFSYTQTLQEINRYPTNAINPNIRKIKIANRKDSYDPYESSLASDDDDYHLMRD